MNVFILENEFGPWKSIDVGQNNRKNICSSSNQHRYSCCHSRHHTGRACNWSPLCKDVQIIHKSANITVRIDQCYCNYIFILHNVLVLGFTN